MLWILFPLLTVTFLSSRYTAIVPSLHKRAERALQHIWHE